MGCTRHRFFYGWIVLAVAFLTLVGGFACRSTFSVFYPIIVEEFGWTRGNTAIIFSISVLVYGLLAPFAGALVDRFKPRLVLAAGIILTGVGMASCSLASDRWQFYLLYGVVSATGLSIAGFAPVASVVANWFYRRRALAFGVLGAGVGFSVIFSYVAQYLIIAFGWRSAYAVIGLSISLLVAPLCLVFVRRTPAEKGLFPDGMSSDEAAALREPTSGIQATSAWRSREWTLGAAMRTRQFWLLFFIWVVCMGIVEQIAISHHVYFYLDAGYEPLTAATYFSLYGICFALGNVTGAISDRIGRERFFFPACLSCTGFVSLYLVMRDTSTPWLPPLIATGFGLSFGSLCCVLNATLADLFQGRHFGRIAGCMIFGFGVGGTLSPWMAGHLYDITGAYTITYYVLIAALIATATMFWLVSPRKLTPLPPRK